MGYIQKNLYVIMKMSYDEERIHYFNEENFKIQYRTYINYIRTVLQQHMVKLRVFLRFEFHLFRHNIFHSIFAPRFHFCTASQMFLICYSLFMFHVLHHTFM